MGAYEQDYAGQHSESPVGGQGPAHDFIAPGPTQQPDGQAQQLLPPAAAVIQEVTQHPGVALLGGRECIQASD